MKLFRIVRVTERVETSQRMVSLSAKSFQTSSALSCKVRQLQAQLTMTQFLQQGARKNVCLQEPQDSWIFHMGAALGETSFLQKKLNFENCLQKCCFLLFSGRRALYIIAVAGATWRCPENHKQTM